MREQGASKAPLPATPTTSKATAGGFDTAGTTMDEPSATQAGGTGATGMPGKPRDADSTSPAARDGAPLLKRVGIQAGHWQTPEVPDELDALRAYVGISVGELEEWEVNLAIARRVASLLQAAGIDVDVLPATVPPGYQADAFVALHCDGEPSEQRSGFKLGRARWSVIPEADLALLDAIAQAYQDATDLDIDPFVTEEMTEYYAFNYGRYRHAIAPTTPAVILEMAFLTSDPDRRLLLDSSDRVAKGIARGILHFLRTKPD
ncbi:MAG: N-acetylmuramoyl-L-alanine amidase [Chloroflexi bacterium]|nr:N-acetylmuramoyl-L-alanine amidase [Chloroflexota bacterium]